MKHLACSIFLFVLSSLSSYAQESFRFEWEEKDNVFPINGIVDNQGNIVIVGYIVIPNESHKRDGFIFSLKNNGEYDFFRYSSPTDSSINFLSLIQVNNGNYMVVGDIGPNDYANPHEAVIFMLFDADLNIISEKRFPVFNKGYVAHTINHCLLEESGNVLCAGTAKRSEGAPVNIYDLALWRLTQEGDTIETSFQHYARNVGVYDFEKIPDSENYLILEFITQLYGEFEWFILKPDLTKDTSNYFYSYDYSLGELNTDYWYPNKDMMLAGSISLPDKKFDHGIGVFRSDTLAHISEQLFLNRQGIDDGQAFMQTMAYADEQSIYIAGINYDFNCQTPDSILLYVVDTALNQVAYKSLGGDLGYEIAGVLTAKDYGAYLYGRAWHPQGSGCNGNLVIYYISRDELGLPPVSTVENIPENCRGTVYPNPACDYVYINLPPKKRKGNERIKLFTIQGQKIYDYKLPPSGNTAFLQINNLSPGTYLYQITNNDQILDKGKFIKQK